MPRQRAPRQIAGVEYRFVHANERAFRGFELSWVTEQEQVQVSGLEPEIEQKIKAGRTV